MRFLPLLILSLAVAIQPVRADDVSTSAPPADNESGFANVDLDEAFTGKLVVLRANSDRSDNNLLSVSATLKNVSNRTVTIQVGTCYADAAGNWLNGGHAGWLSFKLKPHSQFQYRSSSLTDTAHDFLVRIWLAEPAGRLAAEQR